MAVADSNDPMIVRSSLLSCQICVPKTYTADEAKAFAELENMCGTTNGWQIRREAPERVQCEQRPNFVHIMLDA